MFPKWSLISIPEHKRHDLENRVFPTPLVCCSIAPVCSVCAVWLSCAVFLVCAVLQYLCNICVIFVYRRHWVASSSKFIGECTVSMLKNLHYLIESCLNLNLNLEFWSGDSQSEYFYAQKTLNNKLWPSFRNKLNQGSIFFQNSPPPEGGKRIKGYWGVGKRIKKFNYLIYFWNWVTVCCSMFPVHKNIQIGCLLTKTQGSSSDLDRILSNNVNFLT